jgi:hypothetical protein
MKTKILVPIVAVLIFGLINALALADRFREENANIPELINYQGILTDSLGNRLNGTYGMTFCIYKDSVDGTPLWCETQDDVEVTCGIFNVQLGAVDSIPLEVFRGRNRWLGVTVEGDAEMTPRRRFTSTGYAYHAGYAGIRYRIPPDETSVEIPIPHYTPFQLLVSELHASGDHSGWMTGGENDSRLSWVGIDGSGNVIQGTAWLSDPDTILTIGSGLVLRIKGDGTSTLVLETSQNLWGSAATLISVGQHIEQ